MKPNYLIDHSIESFNELSSLYLNKRLSDVQFIIDDHEFNAHKFILMLRSEYFSLMFNSGLKESFSNKIKLDCNQTPIKAFNLILKYIYCGKIQFTDNDAFDDIIDVIVLGHLYQLNNLVNDLVIILQSNLSKDNVIVTYNLAQNYGFESLEITCFNYIVNNGYQLLDCQQDEDAIDSLLSFDAKFLTELFLNDKFCCEEIEIFKFIFNWIIINRSNAIDEQQFNGSITDLVSSVRLNLISIDDLITIVWSSDLVPKTELHQLICQEKSKFKCQSSNVRSCLKPINNMKELINCVPLSSVDFIDSDDFHIKIPVNEFIVINFGEKRLINVIEFELFYDCNSKYSFYIESNEDGQDEDDWQLLYDARDYYCYAKQIIYFNKRFITKLRFNVTRSKGCLNHFIIVNFRCSFGDGSELNQHSIINKNMNYDPVFNCSKIKKYFN